MRALFVVLLNQSTLLSLRWKLCSMNARLEMKISAPCMRLEMCVACSGHPDLMLIGCFQTACSVVSSRLNVVNCLKQTNQIVGFERTRHMVGL